MSVPRGPWTETLACPGCGGDVRVTVFDDYGDPRRPKAERDCRCSAVVYYLPRLADEVRRRREVACGERPLGSLW